MTPQDHLVETADCLPAALLRVAGTVASWFQDKALEAFRQGLGHSCRCKHNQSTRS
jgi:hypothetical protein